MIFFRECRGNGCPSEKERKTKDSLTEHNAALMKQLSDQQEQIQPIPQKNEELSERVRVLEEEFQQKEKQVQELTEKLERSKHISERVMMTVGILSVFPAIRLTAYLLVNFNKSRNCPLGFSLRGAI